jgi:broad specificity phosphatase PhoE
MPMRLYFVRHGESEANLLREISNRGWRHGLTEAGRAQVAALAQALAGAGASRIYTSPLQRAVESAQILAGALRAPITMSETLREFDCGIAEGRADAEAWALYRAVRADWFERGRWESRIEGGESFLEVRDRFVPFVRRVVAGRAVSASPKGESVILVGHGGLYAHMLPLVLANVTPAFAMQQPFPYAGCVLAETTPAGLACVQWCGAPHGG